MRSPDMMACDGVTSPWSQAVGQATPRRYHLTIVGIRHVHASAPSALHRSISTQKGRVRKFHSVFPVLRVAQCTLVAEICVFFNLKAGSTERHL